MTAWSYAEARTAVRLGGSAISVSKKGYHGGGTTVDTTSGDILIFVEDRQPPAPLKLYRSQDDGMSWQIQKNND